MARIIKEGYTGFVKFVRHPQMHNGSNVGWWYTSYNFKNGEGVGVFGTPDDPSCKFRRKRMYNPQTGRYELMESDCGFSQGCFWSDWR